MEKFSHSHFNERRPRSKKNSRNFQWEARRMSTATVRSYGQFHRGNSRWWKKKSEYARLRKTERKEGKNKLAGQGTQLRSVDTEFVRSRATRRVLGEKSFQHPGENHRRDLRLYRKLKGCCQGATWKLQKYVLEGDPLLRLETHRQVCKTQG